MDKVVKVAGVSFNTTADTNWTQNNTLLMDNSSNTVERTIKSLGLKGTLFVHPSSANQKNVFYYTMVYVTGTDGVMPNFAGSEATMNTQLDKYRKNIWLTDSGFLRADNGREVGSIIEFDPSTSRKLMPGQKLYFITMAVYQDTSTAVAVMVGAVLDLVIFFE